MEKHKLLKNFVTKLLEKAGVTEKKQFVGCLTRQNGFMVEKSLENKTFEEFWKETFLLCHRLPFTSYAIN